ncbi:MAG: TetR/AcrR family transcriptional regulator [Paracoccaceae bacterium]
MRQNDVLNKKSKSEKTRIRILEKAAQEASISGIAALTLGGLAQALDMSKSGIYAHFGSMENLQVAVVDFISDQFHKQVSSPVLMVDRGREQLVEFMRLWLSWSTHPERPGGCQIIAASFDYDALDGPVRDHLANQIETWHRQMREFMRVVIDNDSSLKINADEACALAVGIYTKQHIEHFLLKQDDAPQRALKHWVEYLNRAT